MPFSHLCFFSRAESSFLNELFTLIISVLFCSLTITSPLLILLKWLWNVAPFLRVDSGPLPVLFSPLVFCAEFEPLVLTKSLLLVPFQLPEPLAWTLLEFSRLLTLSHQPPLCNCFSGGSFMGPFLHWLLMTHRFMSLDPLSDFPPQRRSCLFNHTINFDFSF